MTPLLPSQIVTELDKHIIGQKSAKRAVAIAVRNRWRRQQIDEPLRSEITPKNILMIGPTGVGKTEIARRLAKLVQAPFIKIEATKFTEVGYVGRDVDTIIRDLVDISIKQLRLEMRETQMDHAQTAAENRILDILLPQPRTNVTETIDSEIPEVESAARQTFRQRLRAGELDEKEIELEVAGGHTHLEIFAPPGMEEMSEQIQSMLQQTSTQRKRQRKLKIREARKLLLEEEADNLVDEEALRAQAIKSVEQNGIVFLDEIDKIASRAEGRDADVSRQGVQRDLLPLVEGTTVSTKYGLVRTDHILFIASGAFHLAKPSDLIPELQGRLPIRVELESLSVHDFEQILTQTHACLALQYEAMLGVDNIHVKFEAEGIRRLAEIAWQVNEQIENIGARRLYTVMEKLFEDVAFEVEANQNKTLTVDAKLVNEKLAAISEANDLARYVL